MELLLPQPFNIYSIRKISELIRGSYALTYESVQSLIQKKLIKTKKIGNSLSCQLNLSAEPQLLTISSLIHSQKFLNKVKFGFVIEEIKEKLNDLFYIMILFGSYAKEKARKDSDVDLLFVLQNETDIENIKKKIELVLSLTKIKVEFEVVTTEWLLKMFEERHSVGREVLEGSMILHGAEQYYTLTKAYTEKHY